MSLSSSASIETESIIPEGICALSHTPIDVNQVIKSVQDDGAGANVVFIGEIRYSSCEVQKINVLGI